MTTLQAQAQRLIDNAPPDVLDPGIIAQTVVPLLWEQAETMNCLQVYLWLGAEEKFVVFTLQNRHDPRQTRRALYGFAQAEDARRRPEFDPTSMTLTEMPILDLLFRVLTDAEIDLLCFFPPGAGDRELMAVQRRDLQNRLKSQVVANRSVIV